jgi:hypothetical protein
MEFAASSRNAPLGDPIVVVVVLVVVVVVVVGAVVVVVGRWPVFTNAMH